MASLNLERTVSTFADFLLTGFISGLSLPILVYHFGGRPLIENGDCAFREAFALALAPVLCLLPSDLVLLGLPHCFLLFFQRILFCRPGVDY